MLFSLFFVVNKRMFNSKASNEINTLRKEVLLLIKENSSLTIKYENLKNSISDNLDKLDKENTNKKDFKINIVELLIAYLVIYTLLVVIFSVLLTLGIMIILK